MADHDSSSAVVAGRETGGEVPRETEWGTAQIFQLDELPAEWAGETYHRAAIRGDDSLVCLNWFEPGHPPWPVHTHPFDQIAFVLSGQMVFTLADQDIVVKSPGVVWIPRDMPHCANIIGNEPCLNLDVFGTPRADFLHLVQYQGAWGRKEN